jgi:signal transduction histidine kinase
MSSSLSEETQNHEARKQPRLRIPGGIRARVTGSATVVVALTLLLAGALLLFMLQQSLVAGIDANLASRAQEVAAQAETANGIRGTIPATAQQTSLVQVLDAHGTVVAATANMRGDGGEYESPVLTNPPASGRTDTSTLTDSPLDRGGAFRVLAKPIVMKGGPGWVYVATSLNPVQAATSSVILLFAIGLPLLLIIVGFTVFRAVAQALKPVDRIRKQASAISAVDLTQRVPVPDSNDEIGKLAAAMNQMLGRLEASAIRQNQFIGDASHELRSPLTALRAQVDVAMAHPEAAEATRVLGIVHEQVARMSMLTEDLLFLARSTEAAPMVLPASVDLDELVLGEVHRLRELHGPDIVLERVDATRILGSHRDLARALRNLADNACDHAETEIRIALTIHNAVAEITVTDDGGGVPLADRERLFERFTRIEDARSRNLSGGGFGLGLAIARQIALSHGGTLTVHDRADGHHGAEFLLRIPLP